MFPFFKSKKTAEAMKNPERRERRFSAAIVNRLYAWVTSYQRINNDLKNDSVSMIARSRDLAKNNENVTGFLNMMQRNIVGKNGFRLQACALLADGKQDNQANNLIETAWYDYQKNPAKYPSMDGTQNGRDFDILVLRTLLTDGEVFIHRVFDDSVRYGARYEVLDALDVDYDYNQAENAQGVKIIMGIELDAKNAPIAYHIRRAAPEYYNTTQRDRIPVSEIIHIFRKFFPGQVRGFTCLSATILNITQLDSYKEAELVAARLQACNMGIYTKTTTSSGFDDPGDDKNGEYATEYSPGVFQFAPDGYDVKQLQNNHPSTNFGAFIKSVLRGIANSLGISYNKQAGDYESTSYSSLREAALEDRESWKDLQQFMIDNWKSIQYSDFLKYSLLNGAIGLPFARIDSYLCHEFHGRIFDWVDPLKDIQAIKTKLELRLTDPITEIENLGKDVDEVLDRWAQWREKLIARGLPENAEQSIIPGEAFLTVDEQAKNNGGSNG